MGIMECMQGELWLGNEPSSISFTNPETPTALASLLDAPSGA